jgi:SAM-dependent methyltransferase
MADGTYDTIAAVYEFLVSDDLLTPQGSAEPFAAHVEPGARVLDCACGTGTLAVGLALAGCDVVATDASEAMVARTARLAAEHGARVEASVCTWDALPGQSWGAAFDVVFCVGNSLAHAVGRESRCVALGAMAAALRPGGLLVVTSRAWEQVRAAGSQLQVGEQLIERGGRRGLQIYAWTIPARWDEPHFFEVAVALVADDGAVRTHSERFAFWPFTAGELLTDLRAVGLEPASAEQPTVVAGRYGVTARRPG